MFDADDYFRSGWMPWTFFAFAAASAEADGMPPDAEARRYLACVQAAGIRAGVWRKTPVKGTCYFGCHKDDIEALTAEVARLEDGVNFAKGFGRDRSVKLMEHDP